MKPMRKLIRRSILETPGVAVGSFFFLFLPQSILSFSEIHKFFSIVCILTLEYTSPDTLLQARESRVRQQRKVEGRPERVEEYQAEKAHTAPMFVSPRVNP